MGKTLLQGYNTDAEITPENTGASFDFSKKPEVIDEKDRSNRPRKLEGIGTFVANPNLKNHEDAQATIDWILEVTAQMREAGREIAIARAEALTGAHSLGSPHLN